MAAPDALVGDRYRLIRELGSGGMGLVWEARDERLGRRVAIKELRVQPGLTESESRLLADRAMREARINARLHHPHAVTVFDVVEHEGRPCLVMELVPSQTLSDVLRQRGTLPLPEVARLGAQIASALAAAHEVGIVHRDVKPGNVLIGEDGRARISDFGISRALGDTTLTLTGMITGTPAFLAPEVARGEAAGPPADVFSLGGTLYAAVEGEPPFGTDSNAMALLHKVAAADFAVPRQAGALRPLLLRMLQREPADRPTMAEVAAALPQLASASVAAAGGPGQDVSTVAIPPPTGAVPAPRAVAGSAGAVAAGAGPAGAAVGGADQQPTPVLDFTPSAERNAGPGLPPGSPSPEPVPVRQRRRAWLALVVAAAALLAVAALAVLLWPQPAPGGPGSDPTAVPASADATQDSGAAPSRSAESTETDAKEEPDEDTKETASAEPTKDQTESSEPTASEEPSESVEATASSSASASKDKDKDKDKDGGKGGGKNSGKGSGKNGGGDGSARGVGR
jgi:hypothetical protein